MLCFLCCFISSEDTNVFNCTGSGCYTVYPWNSPSVLWAQTLNLNKREFKHEDALVASQGNFANSSRTNCCVLNCLCRHISSHYGYIMSLDQMCDIWHHSTCFHGPDLWPRVAYKADDCETEGYRSKHQENICTTISAMLCLFSCVCK